MSDDVRVFISWSGDLSRAVAVALREWLPVLSDRFIPWASDTDIAAGQRGLAQIEAELSGTQFGIVVVTAENQTAPWINFEAGALSKTVAEDAEQRVVPLLVDLDSPSQLTGPLAQFQAKKADREGVLSLLLSLADAAGIGDDVVQRRFAAHWADLEQKIAAARKDASTDAPAKPPREQREILDEILLHVRQMRQESDHSSSRSSSTAGERKHPVVTKNQISSIASAHALEVHTAKRASSGTLKITVVPAPGHEFEQARVDEFTEALVERFGPAEVTSIPF